MTAHSKRLAIISKIVTIDENLGKTAMMKYIYLLQQVYKVPTGYDYEIYTYGPYSSELAGDINLAADFDIIEATYSSKHTGFELRPTSQTNICIDKEKEFINEYSDAISEVIKLFGRKTTKELELSSTIIYVYSNHSFNKWDTSFEEVTNYVKSIKPHFDMDTIKAEYMNLESLGILEKSA